MIKKIVIYSEPLEETDHNGNKGISGDAVNFAIGAARINDTIARALENPNVVDIQMLSAIGNDARGDAIRDFLEDNNVNTDYLATITGHPTGAYKIEGEGAQRKFVYHEDRKIAAVRYLFEKDHLQTAQDCVAQMDSDTYFVISGIGASRPLNEEAFQHLLEMVDAAKNKGAHIVVDPNVRLGLWDNDKILAKERLLYLLKRAETVFITQGDDSSLFGWPKELCRITAQGLRDMGVKNVITKKGRKGAELFVEGQTRSFQTPSFKVTELDGTGGGDTFMAATLVALAHDANWQEATTIASRIASQVVQHTGGVLKEAFVPRAEQLQKDIDQFANVGTKIPVGNNFKTLVQIALREIIRTQPLTVSYAENGMPLTVIGVTFSEEEIRTVTGKGSNPSDGQKMELAKEIGKYIQYAYNSIGEPKFVVQKNEETNGGGMRVKFKVQLSIDPKNKYKDIQDEQNFREYIHNHGNAGRLIRFANAEINKNSPFIIQ